MTELICEGCKQPLTDCGLSDWNVATKIALMIEISILNGCVKTKNVVSEKLLLD
jgi:hypothetical protein